MGAYLVRKTASFVCVLFIISALTFLTLQVLPGDPAQLVLGTESSPQALAALRRELGLDKPAPVRFGQWLVDFVQGDQCSFATAFP